jgi:hypothetical protein
LPTGDINIHEKHDPDRPRGILSPGKSSSQLQFQKSLFSPYKATDNSNTPLMAPTKYPPNIPNAHKKLNFIGNFEGAPWVIFPVALPWWSSVFPCPDDGGSVRDPPDDER